MRPPIKMKVKRTERAIPIFRTMRATGASASLARLALLTCTIVVSVLSGVTCGSLQAVEIPALNATEPVTFQGEIAAGLKIQMKLFRDGSALYGTYLYELYGRDIQVKGTINEAGEIVLQESAKGKVTGTFKGRFVSKERIDGKWYRPGSDKGRTFFLVNAGVSPLTKSAAAPAQAPATKSIETPKAAPKSEVPVPAQQQVKQEVTPVTRELPLQDPTMFPSRR
jgi:hypothetical protein